MSPTAFIGSLVFLYGLIYDSRASARRQHQLRQATAVGVCCYTLHPIVRVFFRLKPNKSSATAKIACDVLVTHDLVTKATVTSNTMKECNPTTLLKSIRCDFDAGAW